MLTPIEQLYTIATGRGAIMAKARELIGEDLLALLIAKSALSGTAAKLSATHVSKILGISHRLVRGCSSLETAGTADAQSSGEDRRDQQRPQAMSFCSILLIVLAAVILSRALPVLLTIGFLIWLWCVNPLWLICMIVVGILLGLARSIS